MQQGSLKGERRGRQACHPDCSLVCERPPEAVGHVVGAGPGRPASFRVRHSAAAGALAALPFIMILPGLALLLEPWLRSLLS